MSASAGEVRRQCILKLWSSRRVGLSAFKFREHHSAATARGAGDEESVLTACEARARACRLWSGVAIIVVMVVVVVVKVALVVGWASSAACRVAAAAAAGAQRPRHAVGRRGGGVRRDAAGRRRKSETRRIATPRFFLSLSLSPSSRSASASFQFRSRRRDARRRCPLAWLGTVRRIRRGPMPQCIACAQVAPWSFQGGCAVARRRVDVA